MKFNFARTPHELRKNSARTFMNNILKLAIAMKRDGVKHIFFIAETKGSMSSMQLSKIENAKIDCAEKLFNSMSTANVRYHKVTTYDDLLDAMNSIV